MFVLFYKVCDSGNVWFCDLCGEDIGLVKVGRLGVFLRFGGSFCKRFLWFFCYLLIDGVILCVWFFLILIIFCLLVIVIIVGVNGCVSVVWLMLLNIRCVMMFFMLIMLLVSLMFLFIRFLFRWFLVVLRWFSWKFGIVSLCRKWLSWLCWLRVRCCLLSIVLLVIGWWLLLLLIVLLLVWLLNGLGWRFWLLLSVRCVMVVILGRFLMCFVFRVVRWCVCNVGLMRMVWIWKVLVFIVICWMICCCWKRLVGWWLLILICVCVLRWKNVVGWLFFCVDLLISVLFDGWCYGGFRMFYIVFVFGLLWLVVIVVLVIVLCLVGDLMFYIVLLIYWYEVGLEVFW